VRDIRILLVDDRELARRGVRGILEQEEDMEIVGDCSTADEALLQAEILSPNIVITGAKIPGIGGIETTRRLHQRRTPCKVIMLASYEDCLAEALEAGVAGYLLEGIKHRELAQAIKRVYQGELVIDERLTSTPQFMEWESEYLRSEGSGSGVLVKRAELVMLPPVDTVRLLRFVYQVEEALEATIVQQVGSWDGGIAITILLRRFTPLVAILDRLGKMPDVEDVREETAAKYKSSSFLREGIARPETLAGKGFLVTLKQASPAKQLELAGYTS